MSDENFLWVQKSNAQKPAITFFPSAFKTLTRVSFALIGALLVWEVILRLVVESSPSSQLHPALGKILQSGTLVQGWEGFARVHLNSLGMRDQEIAPKALGEYRILLLGDSFTRADEVSDAQHFATLMETELTASRGQDKSVNVINAGKPGASPANYLYAQTFHRQVIQPDSVVVQLTAHDFTLDLLNSTAEFYLQPQGNGFKVVKNSQFSSGNALASSVISRLPQVQTLLQTSVLRVGGKQVQRGLSATDSHASPPAVAADTVSTETAQSEAAMVAWTLAQMQQAFPNLVLVYIPAISYFETQAQPSQPEDPQNLAIEQLLTRQAAAQNIPLINLRSHFVAFYQGHQQELRGFNNTRPGLGHLNARGHRLLADKINAYYRSQQLP